jgi:DNA-binding protein H-NS
MASQLASIRKQIEALEKRALDITRAQNKKVIEQIKGLIEKHQLTAADLGLGVEDGGVAGVRRTTKRAGAKKAAKVGVPMYRDPKTGKTWTGRGKPPNWIAKAKDRTRFVIDGQVGTDTPAAPTKAVARKGIRKQAAVASRKGTAAKRAAASSAQAVVEKAGGKRRTKTTKGGSTSKRAGKPQIRAKKADVAPEQGAA